MDALSALLANAEAEDLIWAVLIEHGNGELEVIGYDGNATAVSSRAEARRDFGEWLLTTEPVACVEASAAGIDPLNDCGRCSSVLAAA